MSAHRARLGLALALSPLAAPVAVWLGVLARAAVSPGRLRGSSNPVVDALLLAVLLVAYTAPAAYPATLVFAWPLFRFLQSIDRVRWWIFTASGAALGAILLPLYLHFLSPRGWFDFFPGVGWIAGGAIGLAFWFIATRVTAR